ncbi:MAG: glycosyltransferase family 9 protein [Ignavibacteria bacterium]|nr:glycosyltransferase family 9 protein [Ignavibacteria bacterium]
MDFLIVQIGRIGDMILTTPLFSGLKQLYPDSKITVLAGHSNYIIPKYNEHVDNTIIFKKSIGGYLKLFLELRKRKFDYWIDTKPEYSSTSTKLLKIGRFKKSIGYNTKGDYFDYDLTSIESGKHYTEINLLPLRILDKSKIPTDIKPELFIPQEIEIKTNDLLKKYPAEYVVFNLSVKDETRNWKLQDIAKIYETFNGKLNFVFQFIEKDRHIFDELSALIGEKLNYFNGGILELACVVKNSKLVITPDTSLVHIAASFNIPVIAIYHDVDWNIKRFAPLSDKSISIISEEKNKILVNTDKIIEAIYKML